MNILRQATESSPLAFIVFDSSGYIFSSNRAGMELYGYDEDEFVGLSIQLLNPKRIKNNQKITISDLSQCLSSSNAQLEDIISWQMKSGRIILTEVAISHFTYRGQQFNVANVIDVSHEHKLRNLMERTQEVAQIGSWYVDLQNDHVVWSKMTYQIHELDPNTKITINDGLDFYAPLHRPVITQCVEDGIQLQKGWDVELKILTAKNNELWVRAIGEPIIEDGHVTGLEGTFQNIHEQKLIQLERESLLNKLERTESLAKLGHWELIFEPESVYWSQNLYKIWEFDPNLLPPNLEEHRDYIHKEDRDLFFNTIATNVKNETEYRMVFRIIVNKKTKFIQAEGKPLYNSHNELFGFFGTAQDITYIKESEESLRKSNASLAQANEELTQFAYRTSHDLKAPLATIKGLTTFMQEDLDDKNYMEVKNNIQKVHHHADRLVNLVEDILNLAKADLSNEANQPINLSQLMNDIKSDFEYELKTRNVSCIVDVDKDIYVMTQPVRLRQILENLILNGIKYSNSKKLEKFVKISVNTSTSISNTVDIIVSDNGLGIPKRYHHQLFDMFTRFHTDEAQGSGLGLSIVKKHTMALNANIQFDSSDNGSCFTLAVPK